MKEEDHGDRDSRYDGENSTKYKSDERDHRKHWWKEEVRSDQCIGTMAFCTQGTYSIGRTSGRLNISRKQTDG